jgi:5,10-methylenetetrahydromethanopterin reductase
MSERGALLRVGVRLPPCQPVKAMAAVIVEAEESGLDNVAVPDSPLLWRDPYTTLAVAAAQTSRIGLTVAVSNFSTRHPSLVASAGRTMAELAPGRFRLGVGAGDSAVRLAGQSRPSHADLREGLRVLEELSSGRTVGHGDDLLFLHDPMRFPILMAAEGPRNLALAAAVADGVITSHADSARKHQAIVEASALAGRAAPRHIAITFTCVTDNIARDAQIVKPFILRAAVTSGTEPFERAGFPVRVPAMNLRLPDGTDLGHPRDIEAAVELASEWVSDDLAVWFARTACLFGSAEEVVARLEQLADDGVDEVILHSGRSFALPMDLMRRVAADVIPALRK